MPAVEGYCVKCKSKRDMKDAKEVEMANGRKAMKLIGCGYIRETG